MPPRRPQREPTRLDALATLGLEPGASARQIKRAFRRLALRYHPDRSHWERAGGQPGGSSPGGTSASSNVARFRRVARAYAVLQRRFADGRHERRRGRCERCHDDEPLHMGLDGNRYCRQCLLTATGKRALPAPRTVVVNCGLIATGLVLSALTLAVWTSTGRWLYWWVSVAGCITAMIALASLCLTVQYALPRPVRRTRLARRRRAAMLGRL